MEFKSRYELVNFIGEVLNKEMGEKVKDISSETNDSTGRCDLLIEFKNGDSATISVSMTDAELKSK